MKIQLFTLALAASLFARCSSVGSGQKPPAQDEDASELRKFESSFDPSEEDETVEQMFAEATEHGGEPLLPSDTLSQPAEEQVPGFRVQVHSTASIDEAKERKLQLEAEFPEEWFYLSYDPPAYKIRGGNFTTRFEAERFARALMERGYRDSWVVPERIILNPSRRTPQR